MDYPEYPFGKLDENKRIWDCVIVEGRIIEYEAKRVDGPLIKGAVPQHVTVKGNIPEYIREKVEKELSRLFPIKEIEYRKISMK